MEMGNTCDIQVAKAITFNEIEAEKVYLMQQERHT